MVFEIGQWTVVESAQDIGVEEVPDAEGERKSHGAENHAPVLGNARQAPSNPHNVQPQLPAGPAAEGRQLARQQQALDNHWQQTVEQMGIRLMSGDGGREPIGDNDFDRQMILAFCKNWMNQDSVKAQLVSLKSFAAVENSIRQAIETEQASEAYGEFKAALRDAMERDLKAPLRQLLNDPQWSGANYEAALKRDLLHEMAERLPVMLARDPQGLVTADSAKAMKQAVQLVVKNFAEGRLAALKEVRNFGNFCIVGVDDSGRPERPKLTKALKSELMRGVFDGFGNAQSAREQTKALLERVDAFTPVKVKRLCRFCAEGEGKRAALTEIVREHLDPISDRILAQLELLPEEGVTVYQAAEIIDIAGKEANLRELTEKVSKLKDPDVQAAYLQQIHEDIGNAQSVRFRLHYAKTVDAAAQRFRQVAEALQKDRDYVGAPDCFWDEVDRLLTEQIKTLIYYDGDKEFNEVEELLDDFLMSVDKLHEAVKNIDVGLGFIERRHPEWTPAQKSLYVETMKFVEETVPDEHLTVFSERAQEIEALVSGNHPQCQLPTENRDLYLKVLSLVGITALQQCCVAEKEEALQELFESCVPSLQVVIDLLYGEDKEPLPERANLRDVAACCQTFGNSRLLESLSKRWEQVASTQHRVRQQFKEDTEFWWQSRDNQQKMVDEAVIKAFGSHRFKSLEYGLAHGLKESAAIDNFLGSKDFDLSSFDIPPKLRLDGMMSIASAEARLCGMLQPRTQPLDQVGKASIEVEQPDGRTTKVHDGSDGVASPDDLARFMRGAPSTKSERVLKALKELCGGNDLQYLLALQTMSPEGIPSFGALVPEGGDLRFSFHVTKKANGDLVVTARNGDSQSLTQIESSVVITSDGEVSVTELHVGVKDWELLNP